jgi:tRNA threonylcarbamoyladenosine biosynthesis protein TsaB
MSETNKKYLAWDTSSITGVISAFEVQGAHLNLVATWSLSLETSKHSERLLWSIDTVLQSAGWKLSEISAIAIGVGPGSFTGLRIGLTTARILAKTLRIPVIPISSMALLARGVIASLEYHPDFDQTLLIAATDATKGEWFTVFGPLKGIRDCVSMAEGDASGIWGRGVTETVMTPEDLFSEIEKKLAKSPDKKWIAIGQSVLRHPELWGKLPQKSRLEVSSLEMHRVQPAILARLAYEAIQQGMLRDPSAIKPRYLRASDAEVKLKKGLLKPSPIHPRGGSA